jgi:hypothetical protein
MQDPVVQGFVVCQEKQTLAVKVQSPLGVHIGRDLKKIPEAGSPVFRGEPGNDLKWFVYAEVV